MNELIAQLPPRAVDHHRAIICPGPGFEWMDMGLGEWVACMCGVILLVTGIRAIRAARKCVSDLSRLLWIHASCLVMTLIIAGLFSLHFLKVELHRLAWEGPQDPARLAGEALMLAEAWWCYCWAAVVGIACAIIALLVAKRGCAHCNSQTS